MADTVQYLLEAQIPELEEYERKGYFTKAELKQIVDRRRDFEYRLKRRAALKIDFCRYIEYETKLEELRRHRKTKLHISGKGKSIADSAIIQRIHFIYERAARKFKSDLQLWVDWITYCKKNKSNKMHSKVLTKALQRHGSVPLLWIEAASWEFEQNGNVAAARALMQQGLRMCKHEELMWVEYLNMELMYVQRLRVRRKVMGLHLPGCEEEEQGADGQPAAAAAAAAGEGAGGDAADRKVRAAEDAVDEVLTGAVARIVCKSAFAAFPTSLSLRRSVLQVLSRFSFSGVRELQELVYASLAADFGGDEEAWELLARRPLEAGAGAGGEGGELGSSSSVHAAVCEVYGRAVQAVQSEQMYELYLRYLTARMERLIEAAASGDGGGAAATERAAKTDAAKPKRGRKRPRGGDGAESASAEDVVAAGAELLAAFGAAHAARCTSAEMYLRWRDWARRLGQAKIAGAALRQGCARHPSSRELWARRLKDEAKAGVQGDAALQRRLLATLGQALAAVPAVESGDLWLRVLPHISPGSETFGRLVEMMVAAAAGWPTGPAAAGLGKAASAYLQHIKRNDGIEAARSFYRRFLTLPAPGGDFFRAAIDMESGEEAAAAVPSQPPQAGHEQQQQRDGVRRLFEAAIARDGAWDTELWLRYARHESSALHGVGSVYWRATKALADPDAFITRYHEQTSVR